MCWKKKRNPDKNVNVVWKEVMKIADITDAEGEATRTVKGEVQYGKVCTSHHGMKTQCTTADDQHS